MTNGMRAPAEGVQRKLDLQELVKSATWRELLIELVESNSIDPWDIDIVKIANEYAAAIKGLQIRDLHLPANMTLAASILLRMKSDSMMIFPQEYDQGGDSAIDGMSARITPEVPELVPKFRMQPKRKITLGDLMGALEEAMKFNEKRERIVLERTAPLEFEIQTEDIDTKIEGVHKLIISNLDGEGLAAYSALAKYFGSASQAVFDLFIPMLFLAHRGTVRITQEEFYGEIFIRKNEEENKDKVAANGRIRVQKDS